jgi:hypothetical protein
MILKCLIDWRAIGDESGHWEQTISLAVLQ